MRTQIYDSNTYIKEYISGYCWRAKCPRGLYSIEQRNKFSVGETIEIMKPNGDNIEVKVRRITDEDGDDMESAPHPKQKLYIDLGCELDLFDILRRKED